MGLPFHISYFVLREAKLVVFLSLARKGKPYDVIQSYPNSRPHPFPFPLLSHSHSHYSRLSHSHSTRTRSVHSTPFFIRSCWRNSQFDKVYDAHNLFVQGGFTWTLSRRVYSTIPFLDDEEEDLILGGTS